MHLTALSSNTPLIDELVFQPPVSIIKYHATLQQVRESAFVEVALERKVNETTWDTVSRHELQLSTIMETDHTKTIDVEEKDDEYFRYRFRLTTNYTLAPIAITFSVKELPAFAKYEVILAGIVLIGVYVLIVAELVHRTVAAMIGSFVALAVSSTLEGRPALETVVGWVDFETCCLLFGMMLMVGIFSQTGFFEWCAVKAFKISKGNMFRLLTVLCLFTACISAFLDNVTTIMLIGPVTIRLCKVLEIQPTQIIIALVIFSNIGGTSTAIGDPPNMMIISDPTIRASGQITFVNFSMHLVGGVLLAFGTTWLYLRFKIKPMLQRKPNLQKIQEVSVWKATARRMSRYDSEEKLVRQKLEQHIAQLESEIERQRNEPSREIDITELEEKYIIHDIPQFINSCMVLGVVLTVFFMKHAIGIDLSYAWIAIIGSIVHIIISGIKEMEDVLEKVEWGTLLFFASLFVLMSCLEHMGLIDWVGLTVAEIIAGMPENIRLFIAVTIIVWVSSIVSAVIDNIPYTAGNKEKEEKKRLKEDFNFFFFFFVLYFLAMIPVVLKIAETSQLPLSVLIWALAYGTCFGGNATVIGASANVVGAGICESHGYPITFNTFFKTGAPITALSIFVAWVYLVATHVLIPWY